MTKEEAEKEAKFLTERQLRAICPFSICGKDNNSCDSSCLAFVQGRALESICCDGLTGEAHRLGDWEVQPPTCLRLYKGV